MPFPYVNYHVIQDGGPAGAHHVHQKVMASDATLLDVRHVSEDLVTNADLTAEFTVTGKNTISNVGGTDTTGNYLAIMWTQPG